MEKPKVYVHRLADWYPLYMDQQNEEALKEVCEVISEGNRATPMSEDELVERMEGCKVILSLNGTGSDEITEEVLRRVGTIKAIIISHWWEQFSAIDTEKLGIRVIEGSNANTIAVAEWVLTAALMGLRQITDFDAQMKAGSLWCEPRRHAHMLYGKKVGLVGLGRIGRYVSRMFQVMGATVMVYDKYIPDVEVEQLGVKRVSLNEIFENSDIISLHLPVTSETCGLIGADQFRRIPDGAIFINSARAAIYDEAALVKELEKKRFKAFIDVYAEEPLPVNHPLRTMAHVTITPHIAGDNPEMFRLCGKQAIATLRDYIAGKEVIDRKYYHDM